jgi:uncharacterized membrane protein
MDAKEGITLNGPIFGAFATACLVAVIIGVIWLLVVTQGLALVIAALLGTSGFLLWLIFLGLREFYRWASRGFK